jgi:hypothetical protein
MTTISLGQARSSRFGRTAITAAIKVGRLTRDSGGYLVGRAQLREQFEVGNFTSRPQEFAGGFVDFLLGRGARHRGDAAFALRDRSAG